MQPFGPPDGQGFGRTFLVPGRFVHHGGAQPLHWATFAIVLALLLLSTATFLLLLNRTRGASAPRWGWRRSAPRPMLDPALATLSARYARGEIGRDEFLRASDDLRGARGAPPAEEPTLEQPPPAA
jgi:uncharacterized membrane protein